MYDVRKVLECPIIKNTLVVVETKKIIFEKDNYFIMLAEVIESNQDISEKYENQELETITIKAKGSFYEDELYLLYGVWQNDDKYGWSLVSYYNMDILHSDDVDKDYIYNTLLNYPYNLTKFEMDYLYNRYKDNIFEIIENNPYFLVQDTEIFTFKKADNLSNRTFNRLFSLVYDAIKECSSMQGNLLTTVQQITKKLQAKKININEHALDIIIINMILEDELYTNLDNLTNEDIFEQEFYTAQHAINLMSKSLVKIKKMEEQIKQIEEDNSKTIGKKFQYAEKQKEAIFMLNKGNFLIVTGGPGTGKSTVIKALREMIIRNKPDVEILMAAPTGRASKRMEEATGGTASTIHRLLNYFPGKGFLHNIKNPIKANVLIVDESSMIDSYLMCSLLKSITANTMLILIGDIDQLPPVGAGYPFKDLIESGIITTVKLNQTFRQENDSMIKVNAQNIGAGNVVLEERENEFEIIREINEEKIQKIVIDNFIKCLEEEKKKNDKVKNEIYNVQILTPMRGGQIGVNNLNKIIQEKINPKAENKAECTVLDKQTGENITFRVDDKVMQLTNNYDKGTFNGDLGIITKIEGNKIYVTFENNITVDYFVNEMEENLTLAYATTIHKSQGSEYNQAIILNSMHHKNMLQKNLLYTAITRAKKKVILIGDDEAIKMAILNTDACERSTNLKEILLETYIHQQMLETK